MNRIDIGTGENASKIPGQLSLSIDYSSMIIIIVICVSIIPLGALVIFKRIREVEGK